MFADATEGVGGDGSISGPVIKNKSCAGGFGFWVLGGAAYPGCKVACVEGGVGADF